MDTRRQSTTLHLGQLPPTSRALRRFTTVSIALHAAILAAFIYTRPPQLTPIALPGDRSGHKLLLTYNPGSSAPSSSALKTEKRLPPTPLPSKAPSAPAPATPAPTTTIASASKDLITGADGLGDGNLTIALELDHPYPHPDLTQLPAGTRGDVVVDVVIDSTGRIAKYTITRGLGHGIDETVLATIQQWTFQPAKRNGVPVASEQELLFHYERG